MMVTDLPVFKLLNLTFSPFLLRRGSESGSTGIWQPATDNPPQKNSKTIINKQTNIFAVSWHLLEQKFTSHLLFFSRNCLQLHIALLSNHHFSTAWWRHCCQKSPNTELWERDFSHSYFADFSLFSHLFIFPSNFWKNNRPQTPPPFDIFFLPSFLLFNPFHSHLLNLTFTGIKTPKQHSSVWTHLEVSLALSRVLDWVISRSFFSTQIILWFYDIHIQSFFLTTAGIPPHIAK